MKCKKCIMLVLASMLCLTGCSSKAVKQPYKNEISTEDRAILQDAVTDIDEIARLCELPKPDIKAIESRCNKGKKNAEKLKNKDKKELMVQSYELLTKYVNNKGKDNAYQNFVKALQAKEQLN